MAKNLKSKVSLREKAALAYTFTGHEFELISVAGATLWQYCQDTGRTPEDFALGIQGLSKLIDSNEKSETICADKVLLIGCFLEALDGVPAQLPTE